MRELNLNETQAINGGSDIKQALLSSVLLMTAGVSFIGVGLAMIHVGRLIMTGEPCDVCPTLNKMPSEKLNQTTV